MKIRLRMFFDRHPIIAYAFMCMPLVLLTMSDRLVWLISSVMYYVLIGVFIYAIIKG